LQHVSFVQLVIYDLSDTLLKNYISHDALRALREFRGQSEGMRLEAALAYRK